MRLYFFIYLNCSLAFVYKGVKMAYNSEEDLDMKDEREDEGTDLTGFLFGNIDETGRLESDLLDSESQKNLSVLRR